MTDDNNKSTTSSFKIVFPVVTLLIFFALLNINNPNTALINLTVANVLFALFWLFIIDLCIVGVFLIIFIIIWIFAR